VRASLPPGASMRHGRAWRGHPRVSWPARRGHPRLPLQRRSTCFRSPSNHSGRRIASNREVIDRNNSIAFGVWPPGPRSISAGEASQAVRQPRDVEIAATGHPTTLGRHPPRIPLTPGIAARSCFMALRETHSSSVIKTRKSERTRWPHQTRQRFNHARGPPITRKPSHPIRKPLPPSRQTAGKPGIFHAGMLVTTRTVHASSVYGYRANCSRHRSVPHHPRS
jgi:hypothetical protein